MSRGGRRVKIFRSCERNKWYRRRVPQRSPRKPSARRADLLKALHEAGRDSSTATIMFHTTMASLRGLAPTETKAIDVLDRHGPMTAGELAAKTSLAPPSVTGLINRLERKGFVRRVADPSDRRRVRVELAGHAIAAFAPLFQDFVDRLDALYATYTDDELQTGPRLHAGESPASQRDATARLARAEVRAPARSKRALVRRRPVDRGHRPLVQPAMRLPLYARYMTSNCHNSACDGPRDQNFPCAPIASSPRSCCCRRIAGSPDARSPSGWRCRRARCTGISKPWRRGRARCSRFVARAADGRSSPVGVRSVPGLDDAEVRALLMAQPRVLGDRPLAAAAERALAKLMASLPRALRERAASMRERLYVDPHGWRGTAEDLSMLPRGAGRRRPRSQAGDALPQRRTRGGRAHGLAARPRRQGLGVVPGRAGRGRPPHLSRLTDRERARPRRSGRASGGLRSRGVLDGVERSPRSRAPAVCGDAPSRARRRAMAADVSAHDHVGRRRRRAIAQTGRR